MTLVDVNPFLRDFFIIKGELTHIPINSPLCVLFNNKTIPSNIKAKLSYFSYDSDYWFPLSIGIGATEGLFMVPFKCRLVDTLTEKVVSKNKIQRENYKNECPWKKNHLQILDRYVAKREDDPTIFVICDVREGNHIMVILT